MQSSELNIVVFGKIAAWNKKNPICLYIDDSLN